MLQVVSNATFWHMLTTVSVFYQWNYTV